MVQKFAGVSEGQVQDFISKQEKALRLNPLFSNKAPLTPVKSSSVMSRVQIDLVDMQKRPVSIGSNEYKYILVMLDVCSRLLFLRPLSSKYAAEVASTLLQLFSDVGLPKIVQSDQGGEFKGVVKGVVHYL